MSPSWLIFEITETSAVANIPRARDFGERLSELGCRFALDDFGAGFGSFYYLKHLPFDYLKIDGEFVRNCVTNATDRLIIESVVGIARGLHKQTIAEFVGDEETVRMLTELRRGLRPGLPHRQARPAGGADRRTGRRCQVPCVVPRAARCNVPSMPKRKASDVFVECLEAEGVKHVFGIPGEETLDLNESLSRSSIDFVPVRHEQGGGYMADTYGRLTGNAGVCLGTLGPGALNLTTPVADAYLDRAPLVALTGQGDLERMHKESHQYIDLVRVMAAHHQVERAPERPPHHPRGGAQGVQDRRGREARLHAHRAARGRHGGRAGRRPAAARAHHPARAQARELLKAADVVRSAMNPVALAGNGVIRANATPALREFVRATGIPVAETFMGKGLIPVDSPKALGSVGLQAGDYAMAGFDEADVVLAIGYDLVEHSPEHWNGGQGQEDHLHRLAARRGRRVLRARGRADRRHLPHALAAGRGVPARAPPGRLDPPARGRARPLRRRQGRRPLPGPAPARAVRDPQGARAARTSWSPTSACTSCGSGACSRPTSPTRC